MICLWRQCYVLTLSLSLCLKCLPSQGCLCRKRATCLVLSYLDGGEGGGGQEERQKIIFKKWPSCLLLLIFLRMLAVYNYCFIQILKTPNFASALHTVFIKETSPLKIWWGLTSRSDCFKILFLTENYEFCFHISYLCHIEFLVTLNFWTVSWATTSRAGRTRVTADPLLTHSPLLSFLGQQRLRQTTDKSWYSTAFQHRMPLLIITHKAPHTKKKYKK